MKTLLFLFLILLCANTIVANDNAPQQFIMILRTANDGFYCGTIGNPQHQPYNLPIVINPVTGELGYERPIDAMDNGWRLMGNPVQKGLVYEWWFERNETADDVRPN